jgi:hypothetical protein
MKQSGVETISCNETKKAALYLPKSMATLFEDIDSAFIINIIVFWVVAPRYLVDYTNFALENIIMRCT